MAHSKTISRREFSIAFAAGAALIPFKSFALSGDQAETLIRSAVDDINRIIASGKSEASMLRDFERVFARYADVNIVALTTLGPARRSASNAQINAYVSAFQDYFTRKYGRRFREFIGGQITVNGSRKSKSNYEVQSTARLQGSAPFKVIWLVSDRSGSPRIFNIIIEGVNVLTSERAEIGAMLDKRGGNLDQLTADLRRLG